MPPQRHLSVHLLKDEGEGTRFPLASKTGRFSRSLPIHSVYFIPFFLQVAQNRDIVSFPPVLSIQQSRLDWAYLMQVRSLSYVTEGRCELPSSSADTQTTAPQGLTPLVFGQLFHHPRGCLKPGHAAPWRMCFPPSPLCSQCFLPTGGPLPLWGSAILGRADSQEEEENEWEWDKVEGGVPVSVKMAISDLTVQEILGVISASWSEGTAWAALFLLQRNFLQAFP